MGRRLLAVALLFLLACSSSGNGPGGADVPRGTTLRNVQFCSPGGFPLRMDLYFPDEPSTRPVLVFVHGGAWVTGTKEEANERWLGLLRAPLVARGFIVASIEHRLSPAHRWPAHVEDGACAVRYLRAHAAEYGLDSGRIGAWGSSSGGHIVALLGTAADGDFATAEWAGFSSRVSPVVDLYGPADLTSDDWGPEDRAAFSLVFTTGDPASPILVEASPVTLVSPGDAPFLIFHGDEDTVVPVSQSVALDAALGGAGVASELVVVEGGNHGLPAPTDPTEAQIVARIVDFFAARLQP